MYIGQHNFAYHGYNNENFNRSRVGTDKDYKDGSKTINIIQQAR